MVIIGLAGGRGSGKSTIVQRLVARIGGCVIDLDSYYQDRSALPPGERSRISYDEPTAIDAALLVNQLAGLRRGEAVRKPVYSFATHARTGTEVVAPARLVLVEGLFTLWWESLRSLLDVKVFVDASPDLRLTRRIRRGFAERSRPPARAPQQYSGTVHPMHDRYVELTRTHADLVVTNDGPLEDAVERLITIVRRRRLDGLAHAAARS